MSFELLSETIVKEADGNFYLVREICERMLINKSDLQKRKSEVDTQVASLNSKLEQIDKIEAQNAP